MLKVVNDNVLLEPINTELKTASGLLLVSQDSQNENTYGVHTMLGKVVKIPENYDFPDGFEFGVGDTVIYDKALGQMFTVEGKEFFLSKIFDILAVVEKE